MYTVWGYFWFNSGHWTRDRSAKNATIIFPVSDSELTRQMLSTNTIVMSFIQNTCNLQEKYQQLWTFPSNEWVTWPWKGTQPDIMERKYPVRCRGSKFHTTISTLILQHLKKHKKRYTKSGRLNPIVLKDSTVDTMKDKTVVNHDCLTSRLRDIVVIWDW